LNVDLSAVGTGVRAFLGTSTDNGFVLLAGALKRARRDENAMDNMVSVSEIVSGVPTTPLTFQKFLGSGAFSNVVKLGKSEFMKIPKAACLAADLVHEASILNHLQCPTPKGIPILACSPQGVSAIQFVVRGELSRMPCLRLRGVVGTLLNKLPHNVWQASAKDIVSQVVAALKFAHGREVYHLDVRPGNIIVGKPVDESPQCVVLLSDWGCSIRKEGKQRVLKKFRGCTPYAHDSLLGEWGGAKLKPELDFASLLYTCIHVDKGILQWVHAFDRPLQVSDADMLMRRELATLFVELPRGCFSRLDTEIQETLKSVVLPPRRDGLRAVTRISYF
jgi:serine/threonine protein kinase